MLAYNLLSLAPGVVSFFLITPSITTIVLSWSPPEEPNGAILGYEVTYRVTEKSIITYICESSATSFTISSLAPGTQVSEISVAAYNLVGWGESTGAHSVSTYIKPCEYIDNNRQYTRIEVGY